MVSRMVTPSLVAQILHVPRKIAARRRVEAGGGFVHQQHLRPVQQRFGDLDAAPQAAGERLHQVLAAVGQPSRSIAFSMRSRRSAPLRAVQVALRAQVLLHGERFVEALRLEHHADVAAHRRRVRAPRRCPASIGAAFGGDHHGGENAEEGGLAAAVRPQQAEDLALFHFEADVRKRDAVTVAMGEILNLDHKPGLSSSISP